LAKQATNIGSAGPSSQGKLLFQTTLQGKWYFQMLLFLGGVSRVCISFLKAKETKKRLLKLQHK
jgi:hypothetical protein